MSDMENMDAAQERADELLAGLLHLKGYERPDPARIARSKQNIMRHVRQSQASKRKPLLDLLELNIPWFFSEPKYGLAALFIAFVGLQYVGMSTRNSQTSTGIYTASSSVREYEAVTRVETNRYPNLPRDYRLFGQPEGDATVVPVGFEYK